MRGVLAALRDARAPFHVTTRSPLVVRDADLLAACARRANVSVNVSIATLDEALAREIEPTVAPPRQRLRTVRTLAAAGVPVGVAVAPVLPELTDADDSMAAVVHAAADAGASHVWHNTLNLGDVTRDAYFAFLESRRPALVARYHRLFTRGKYADSSYARNVTARFHAVCAATRFARRSTPERDGNGEQLALLRA